jgi:hypothetical protein
MLEFSGIAQHRRSKGVKHCLWLAARYSVRAGRLAMRRGWFAVRLGRVAMQDAVIAADSCLRLGFSRSPATRSGVGKRCRRGGRVCDAAGLRCIITQSSLRQVWQSQLFLLTRVGGLGFECPVLTCRCALHVVGHDMFRREVCDAGEPPRVCRRLFAFELRRPSGFL